MSHISLRNPQIFFSCLTFLQILVLEINCETRYSSLSHESRVISNLNEYLNLFDNCLIHLINYPAYDILPPNVPLVLSRYYFSVWEEFDVGENASYVTPGLSPYFGNYSKESQWIPENVKWPQIIRSNTYNWRCRAQFYLNPPENFTQIASDLASNHPFLHKDFKIRIPYSYSNFSNNFVPEKDADRGPGEGILGPETGNYHILLQPQNHDRAGFQFYIDQLQILEPKINLVVLTLGSDHQTGQKNSSTLDYSGPLRTSIQSAGVICQYCDKYRRILVPLASEEEPLSRLSLDTLIKDLNEVNNGVPWDAYNLNIIIHLYVAEMQQELIKAVQKGSLKFTNVREYIQGPLGGKGIKDFLKRWKIPYIYNKLSIETLFLTLAVPNLTLDTGQPNWCLQSPNCDRRSPKLGRQPRAVATEGFKLTSLQKTPEEYLQFITCGYQSKTGISFEAFISAYDIPTWIFLIVTLLGLGTLLSVTSKLLNKDDTSLNLLSMAIKMLLEQGDDIVSNVKQLGYLYWVCGVWLLASVVLSNGYKGQNITDLTAPLKFVGLTNFSQLLDLNFTILTNIIPYWGPKDIYQFQKPVSCLQVDNIESKYCKTILLPNGEFHSAVYRNAPKLKSYLSPQDYDFLTRKLYKKVYLPTYYDQLHKGVFTFANVLYYRTKVAYVGWADKVDLFEKQLAYMNVPGHISKSEEKLFSRQVGWDVQNWEDPRILLRLKILTSSGIADVWRAFCKKTGTRLDSIRFAKYRDNLAKKKSQTPLTIMGNTATVFVVFITGLGTSTLCFIWEVRRSLGLAAKTAWAFLSRLKTKLKIFIENKRGGNPKSTVDNGVSATKSS